MHHFLHTYAPSDQADSGDAVNQLGFTPSALISIDYELTDPEVTIVESGAEREHPPKVIAVTDNDYRLGIRATNKILEFLYPRV